MMNAVKDLKETGNAIIGHIEKCEKGFTTTPPLEDGSENVFIIADHINEKISFDMMTRPVSEGGKGCQLTDLIEVALHQIKYLNEKFPCMENSKTISHLETALEWQKTRTENRKERGVEGKNEL